METINYLNLVFGHQTKTPFLFDYFKRQHINSNVSENEFLYECLNTIDDMQNMLYIRGANFNNSELKKQVDLIIDNLYNNKIEYSDLKIFEHPEKELLYNVGTFGFISVRKVLLMKGIINKIIKNKTSTPPPEQKDFSGLLKNLTPLYINNCSTTDLYSIVIDKKLPLGRNPINWTGTKADAIRFIEHFSISKKQFNDMFILEDGKPLLAGHKDKNDTYSDLTDILKNH